MMGTVWSKKVWKTEYKLTITARKMSQDHLNTPKQVYVSNTTFGSNAGPVVLEYVCQGDILLLNLTDRPWFFSFGSIK